MLVLERERMLSRREKEGSCSGEEEEGTVAATVWWLPWFLVVDGEDEERWPSETRKINRVSCSVVSLSLRKFYLVLLLFSLHKLSPLSL